MKIYTITCHDVYNVGASLQAYALAAYLENKGHHVEIIDYKPDYLSRHYRLTGINNPQYDKPLVRELYLIAKLPGRWKAMHSRRKAEFDRFKAEMLPVTKRRYISNEDLKANLPEADVYLAGSDQIWNCFFPNGKDPAFYLDFAPENAMKASYAASFATEDVPEDCKPQIKQWLSKLDAVSVRESSGVEIVNRLGITEAKQVLDPVFLLPEEHWEQIAATIADEEPYVLLYDFDRNSGIISTARKLADDNGWKLYSVLPCPECDRSFDQQGPCTFLSLVHNAQFVISNSFHATAFSLIFHKNFAVCKRNENINTRMVDMLALAGLENRMMNGESLELSGDIDYLSVNNRVQKAALDSQVFLENILAAADGKKN